MKSLPKRNLKIAFMISLKDTTKCLIVMIGKITNQLSIEFINMVKNFKLKLPTHIFASEDQCANYR